MLMSHCPSCPAWSDQISTSVLIATPACGHSTVEFLHFSGRGVQVQRQWVIWPVLLLCNRLVLFTSFLLSTPVIENSLYSFTLLGLRCFGFRFSYHLWDSFHLPGVLKVLNTSIEQTVGARHGSTNLTNSNSWFSLKPLSDRYNYYSHFKSKETWSQAASVLY